MSAQPIKRKDFPSLALGDRVYLLISPDSPGFERLYRPRPYFVLETFVVSIDPDTPEGEIEFNTSFWPQEKRIVADLKVAKEQLMRLFARQTFGKLKIKNVLVVTHEEEHAALFGTETFEIRERKPRLRLVR